MSRPLLPVQAVLACCAAGAVAGVSHSLPAYLGAAGLCLAFIVALCRADMLRRRGRQHR